MLFSYLKKHHLAHCLSLFKSFEHYQAGWGRKKSYYRAKAYAEKQQQDCLCLEDGFVRSLGLGKAGFKPLSLVADETGIYFDATASSDLEKLILRPENLQQNQRALAAMKILTEHKITKYNQRFAAISTQALSKLATQKNILIIDQTFGDQSIQFAGANATTFKQMLQQAHQNHPDAQLWVKMHPDVLAGKSQGHFSAADLNQPYIHLMTEHVNPFDLLKYFSDVYVVSSQMGFEALLSGKVVHCFGVPWYAAWGLTQDYAPSITQVQLRRSEQRSLAHLFACAYFDYAQYVSPITAQPCQLEDILQLLIPNLALQKRLPAQVVVYGFSPWKKKFIQDYLHFPNTLLHFKRYLKPKKTDYVLAWGKKSHQLKQMGYSHVMTVEDGFIRSVGLGASLIRPCSLVFDDLGIYYDATQPSRIEQLLSDIDALNPEQIQRTDQLLSDIQRLEISKYNVGEQIQLQRPVQDQKVILVVGQVEDDMSIQLGGVDIKTNLALLQQVRADHPQAYIIYKPHPDVEAGLRIGKIESVVALDYADKIEKQVSIQRLFDIIDEIHTISSLSGFEALIRGLKVYCYGLPFYAGWGLTIDRHSCVRRKNRLGLKQLLYVTLIEYPVYNLAPTAKMDIPLVNPEDVIAYISRQKTSQGAQSNTLRTTLAKCLRSLSFWKK